MEPGNTLTIDSRRPALVVIMTLITILIGFFSIEAGPIAMAVTFLLFCCSLFMAFQNSHTEITKQGVVQKTTGIMGESEANWRQNDVSRVVVKRIKGKNGSDYKVKLISTAGQELSIAMKGSSPEARELAAEIGCILDVDIADA